MNIRRRGVLVLGAVSLASATVGCGQLIHGREIPEYLSDFDGVTSVEKVDTEHWYYAWNVTLENDPPVESVLAIVRSTSNKLASDVKLYVGWVQGATSMTCHLPMGTAEKVLPVVMGAVSPEMESVRVTEEQVSIGYLDVEVLSDDFILPSTSPLLGADMPGVMQGVSVGESSCSVTQFRGADLSSVPLKAVMETVASDEKVKMFVHLEADDPVSKKTCLRVNRKEGVNVDSAASVLGVVLGNQALQRVELDVMMNGGQDSETVAFEMEAGAVIGSGDPPEQGAAILAAAQQVAVSSS